MSGCFKIIRWIFATVLIGLLFLMVVAGIPISVFSRSITQKDTAKEWLKSSDLYNDVLDISIELVSENQKDNPEISDLLLQVKDSESEIGKLVRDKFTPQFTEQSVNTILDGTYDWLEGDAETLTFEVQILEDEAETINILTVWFQAKLKGLPACTSDDEIPSEFNPFEVECLPPGYDTDNTEAISTYLTDNADTKEIQELLQIAETGSVDMDVDPETTRIFRQTFRALNVMPFIFAGIVFILSLLIILLVPGFSKGVLVAGFSLTIPTVVVYIGRIFASGSFVSTSLSGTSFSTINTENTGESALSAETAKILTKVSESVFKAIYVDILGKTGLYCIVLLAISTLLVIIGISLGSKSTEEKYRPAPKKPKSPNADTSTPKSPTDTTTSPTPASLSAQQQPVQPLPPTQTVPPSLSNNDLESIMPKQRPTPPAPPPV